MDSGAPHRQPAARRPAPALRQALAHWPAIRLWVAATIADGVTDPPAPRSPRLRRGRVDLVFVADVLLAAIFFGLTNAALGAQNASTGAHRSTDMLYLVAFLACAPLVLRTRFPLTAWLASAAATFWTSLVIPPRSLSSAVYLPAGLLVYGLCLYAVAVRCRGWVVAGAAVVTAAGAVVVDLRTAIAAVLAAIPLLAGLVVRSRRSSQEQLAVAERRHQGERALLEERQRIARELHDIVAHHMSVIAIQAEAAPYKIADPPPELVESFTEIRGSALSGLDELRRLLGVLRHGEAGTAPQPGLADLGSLLDSARSGGVTVTAAIAAPAGPIPQGVDLSAYRIVQEALSNAMRHAPGSAVRVAVTGLPGGLALEVRNDGCPPAGQAAGAADDPGAGPGAGGHGLAGMRERAAMLGGHLSAGPTANGEFLVTAFLPFADPRAAAAS